MKSYLIEIQNYGGKDLLTIGVRLPIGNYVLRCERTLRGVSKGIEAALNTTKAFHVFGKRAFKNGDIDIEFINHQRKYDQEKVKIDYKVVITTKKFP